MTVSCIIPTRDRSTMVRKAIASIINQGFPDLEIVVVDDGSRDNTAAEINSRFPEVRLVRTDGRGPGAARNAGVEASSGDILMFLDSDDIWLGNHVRQLLDVMDRGFEVAYGTTKTVDEIGGGDFLIPENGKAIEGDCFDALCRWCFLVPSSVAVSRRGFDAVRGFDSIPCGEDWTFFLKLGARFPFGYGGPAPLTLRRLHRGSLCFLGDKNKLLAIINQVAMTLDKEPRASALQRSYFKMLSKWTEDRMNRWATVQDWYLAMAREKII